MLTKFWPPGQRSQAHIAELRALSRVWVNGSQFAEAKELGKDVERFLDQAREAASRERLPWVRYGAFIDIINTNVHAALCLMMRYAPSKDLLGWMPEINAIIRAHLPAQDPRRLAVEELVHGLAGEKKAARSHLQPGEQQPPADLDDSQRETVVTAVRAALEAREREFVRVRSFRNIVHGTTLCLTLFAIVLGTLMAVKPVLAPICFQPGDLLVCPTMEKANEQKAEISPTPAPMFAGLASSWDYFVIELVGLIAAAVASTASLRQIRGTSLPYSIPLALALLKLPTGALTAILGLLLLRGQFIPGLSELDSSAQIIAWAVVFGYGQQLFTHLVDERGQAILNSVGGAEHGTLMDQRMSPPPAGANT